MFFYDLQQNIVQPAAFESPATVALGEPAAAPVTPAGEPQLFTSDDLLLMEVRVGEYQLAESMDAYSSRSGVFLPLGQLSRLLDLAIGTFPQQRYAEGWILSPDRKVALSLPTLSGTVDGRLIRFATNQAVVYDDDIYVRADLLEQILPLKLTADLSSQLLTLAATEPLPFQERLAREQRRAGIGAGNEDVASVRIDTPFRLFSPPAFDVNIGGQSGQNGTDPTGQFDVRAAGDLAFASFQGFAGANERGDISSVRVLLERKDPYGRALGQLRGTRAGLGDVYTPPLAMGAGSSSGRGIFFSSAQLEATDLSTPLELRGELPLGDEVELYVNEVLQGAQVAPQQGRYQFLNVPLRLGLNTIRLVFYGPQSQRREEVRRINFGAGQIPSGRSEFRFGAVQQGRAVIEPGEPLIEQERGDIRFTGTIDYGVSSRLTLSGGVARFKPQGNLTRTMGLLGLRGSLSGVAAQANYAIDDLGGQAVGLGLAARPFGISLVGNHVEYFGGFIDELKQPSASGLASLKQASDARMDVSVPIGTGITVPMSFDVRRTERQDGQVLSSAGFRTSAPINRFYVSTSLAYDAEQLGTTRRQSLMGSADLSTLVAAIVQLRAGIAYQISPDFKINSVFGTADFKLSDSNALRVGVFSSLEGDGETSIQLSNRYQARKFDVSINAGYEIGSQNWQVGFQLGFAFAQDSRAGGYRLARPGASVGGGVTVNAFIDDNGDRIRQAEEDPVPGIVVDTPSGPMTTDKDGWVRATGLGDGARARIRLDTEEIEDPFLMGGPRTLTIVPRPGRIAAINYPMERSGEVEITAMIQREGSPDRPLAALNIELVPTDGGAPVAGRTAYGGVAFFEGIRPGVYDVRLQSVQASALKLVLSNSVKVTVPAGGGFVRSDDILVRLESGTVDEAVDG